jgi:hypothetical protein
MLDLLFSILTYIKDKNEATITKKPKIKYDKITTKKNNTVCF